jgi:hypothetical protein
VFIINEISKNQMTERMPDFEKATAEQVRAHFESAKESDLRMFVQDISRSDLTLHEGWSIDEQLEIARQILEERHEKAA